MQTTGSSPNPFNVADGGFFSIVFGFAALGLAAVTLLPSLWVGGALIAYWIINPSLIAAAIDEHSEHQPNVAIGLMVASLVASALAGLPVYVFHWVSFKVVGWGVTGLFVGGLLFGILQRLHALLALFALLVAAAMASALIFLPVPDASIADDDASRETFVDLLVVDEFNQPRANARAACVLRMIWNSDDAPEISTRRSTGVTDEGHAIFIFHEDPRLKVAVCSAMAQRQEDWSTGALAPGYRPASAASQPLVLGAHVEVKIRLTERSNGY